MIRRLYINNYRCLENFELPLSGRSTTLLIGKNGSGKTTISLALEILQKVARGTSRVADLVTPQDFGNGRAEAPMRFEIEIELLKKIYRYELALEFPRGFRELRVFEEKFIVDGKLIYLREAAKVHITKNDNVLGLSNAAVGQADAMFFIDWHLVALPIVQDIKEDSLFLFKQWLGRALILSPVPSLISGESNKENLQPDRQLAGFAAWFTGLLAHSPSAYTIIDHYLKALMSDFKDITNPIVGTDSRSLRVQFSNDHGSLSLPFEDLSDGEKCFIICALVLAANQAYGPLLCFWDEPDNYLALSEISQFTLALRKAFNKGGQFIATSHNPETIRSFPDESILVIHRRSHLEPAMVRSITDLERGDDLVGTLIRGDLEF